MQTTSKTVSSGTSAKEAVLSFIDALNDGNFDEARKFVHDDMVFHGVLGVRNGADEYFRDMRKMKFKYAVQKIFVDDEDVCLWYDINMQGLVIFSCGWYKVEDGKISSFKVIFDPRPVLEQTTK